MPNTNETPQFDFFEIDASFEAIKKSANYPEDFYYEIFVIAKTTAKKEIRTECTNIIKKQAPENLQAAFKSRKKISQKGGVKSVDSRLVAMLEYGLLSDELDLFKLHSLLFKEPELGLFNFTKNFLDRLVEHPNILGRLNGIQKLEISLKDEGNGYNSILEYLPQLTTLEELEIKADFEQLPEESGNLVNLKQMKLNMPYLQQIPASIGKLKALEEFNFKGDYSFGGDDNNTYLKDFNWLSHLTSLKVLKLQYVGVEDLSEVVFPSTLNKIDLFGLDELTALPKEMKNLPKLERFKVVSDSLATLPTGFEAMPELQLFELIAPKITTISSDFFFGFESKPNLVTKIGNRNVDIAPMTKKSSRKELNLDTPKLLNYVLDNAEFFQELTTISIDCEAPETKHTNTLAAFKNLTNITFKLVPDLDWIFGKINESETIESITLYKNTSYATPVDEAPSSVNVPAALSKIEKLKQFTVQFENHLELNTDALPIHTEQLTIKGLKGIVPGKMKRSATQVYVENTSIFDLKEFYNVVDAEQMDLGKNNSYIAGESGFGFLKNPEYIKKYEYTGPASNVAELLKTCPNLERLFIEFPEDKPEFCAGLSGYKNLKLKSLQLNNYKGDSASLQSVLEQTPNLEHLELRECEGIQNLPKVTLNKLKILELYSCDVQTVAALEVPKIEAFKVNFCDDFGYDAVETITQWKTLKYLWLEHISKEMKTYPEAIATLNLDTLLISGKNSKREIPQWLGTMKSLRVLGIEGFKQSTLPIELATLTQLEVLSITGCEFQERISEEFKNLNLKKLVYWTSKFSGSNMKYELYEPLVGKCIAQRYLDDDDKITPFKLASKDVLNGF
ncbi:leucine-rich repeat domain-containing protein [Maribacter litoralis]|uniref:At1g61320/AtMIF1 LRR domain-containing protein n=1 Tax=Maribacter litoralis TaxID=2059726 RepID=A0A653TYZ6_9FLAO|nr:hypothetical protein [Maribacter litoralis]VXB80952.1 conserved hypothetical protein [Maribacter litoralis]